MTRPFTPAWLAAEPGATALLPRAFGDAAERAAAVDRARPIRGEVLAALRAQERERPQSLARSTNLELLARGAAAVVTGQQVGLFLGPLYTLHKAASAIVDAQALSAETGRPVVPVFWLQTEDHDFLEVQSAHHVTSAGLVTLTVADELAPDARVSLSARRLGPSVSEALAGMGLQGAHAEEVTALLQRYYTPEATWAEAFGNTIAALFADHGLLVFDPRAPCSRRAIAELAAPTHAFALERAAAIHAALCERAEAISGAGFAVQIGVREAALSCYAPGDAGPRHRIERGASGGDAGAQDSWCTKHCAVPQDALATTPERFTTTALLRPLLQDTLLPTAAYVGGPGELAYFTQLPPLYALAGMAMPLAVPRARFTLVTATARRLAEQLGVSTREAARPRSELALQLSRTDMTAFEARFAAMTAAIDEGFVALDGEATRLGDTGYGKHAKKASEVVFAALERLRDRSLRMAAEADTTTSDRLDRFQALLHPREAPQERVLGFAPFAAQVGIRALIDAIVAGVVPFDGTPKELDV